MSFLRRDYIKEEGFIDDFVYVNINGNTMGPYDEVCILPSLNRGNMLLVT
ncbi:hypothetical protein LJC11_00650 [Bacteroidales bacterium OttesenSCG-928-I21]|nr:hypothetical protein [Bacteroidales bacterium OttesenSCG-928-I21]